MHYTIDRFEDNGWAVLETPEGQTFKVPTSWLPDTVVEGDVLVVDITTDLDQHSQVEFAIDETETNRRLKQAKQFRDRLPKGPEGDLEL